MPPRISIFTGVALTLAMSAGASTAADAPDVTIGTGNLAGLYYPVGGAVAGVLEAHAEGLDAAVESTVGSMENLVRVGAGDLSIGIARSDLLHDALLGLGAFEGSEPMDGLKVLFALHPEPITVIARRDADINEFSDLRGKRINFGPSKSASRAMIELLLEAWEWTEGDFAAVEEIEISGQVEALCAGTVDAVAFVAAHPTGTIGDALEACDTKLVPVVGEPVAKLLQAHPFLTTAVIPGGLYQQQEEAVQTVGPVAVMVAGEALPDGDAYRVTRALFENPDDLGRFHPVLEGLTPTTLSGHDLGAPMHPGAIRYYREAGILELSKNSPED